LSVWLNWMKAINMASVVVVILFLLGM